MSFGIKCSKTKKTFAFPYQCKPVVPAWGNMLHSSSLFVTILKQTRSYSSLKATELYGLFDDEMYFYRMCTIPVKNLDTPKPAFFHYFYS